MPIEPLLAVLVAIVAANLALLAVVAALALRDRRRGRDLPSAPEPSGAALDGPVRISGDGSITSLDGVPTEVYERIARVASFLFILIAACVVVVTGMWPDTELAILIVLAISGLSVLAIHDLLGPILGAARFVVEGPLAITLVALLVALTGRETSPFFFALPIIVAGAALVVEGLVTFVLTIGASVAYLAAVAVRPPGDTLGVPALTGIALNLAALLLLAYVASFVAREQRRSRAEAVRLSTMDSLTGLHNRSYFYGALEREIQRSARSGRGFCLVMMDLDGLKTVNDRFGHFHGDAALRTVGDTIRAGVRRIDTAARYGGDEFVVVLPETDPGGAFVLAEKIRQGVGDKALRIDGRDVPTSLSVGVVVYPRDGATVDELMIAADATMYRSKRQGKNQVVGSWSPTDGGVTGLRPMAPLGIGSGEGRPESV